MVDWLYDFFGAEFAAHELTLQHFMMRAFLVYFVGMFLVRIQTQFMGISTPFNYMLNFIVGSMLATAIIGEVPYFPVILMCLFMALMNWLIALLCYYNAFMEKIFKGTPDLLVKDGHIVWKNMRKNLITKDELLEAVHKETSSTSLVNVKKAYFENSGQITVTTH